MKKYFTRTSAKNLQSFEFTSLVFGNRLSLGFGIGIGLALMLSGLSAFAGDPEDASFKDKLYTAIVKSPLSDDEKIEHVMNRLGFGARPEQVAAFKHGNVAINLVNFISTQVSATESSDTQGHHDDAFISAQLSRFRKCVSPDVFDAQHPEAGIKAIPKDAYCYMVDHEEIELEAYLNYFTQRRSACYALSNRDSKGYCGNVKCSIYEPYCPGPKNKKDFLDAYQHFASLASSIESNILSQARFRRMLLASHSKFPLREQLTDFWFNHFNVNEKAGFSIAPFENGIRENLAGSFSKLLHMTARSRAMSFYLDGAANQYSLRYKDGGDLVPLEGLNENYARELIELHTIGLNSEYSINLTAYGKNYTQEDVRNAARILSGWGSGKTLGEDPDGFRFNAYMHNSGAKVTYNPKTQLAFSGNGSLLQTSGDHVCKLRDRVHASDPVRSCVSDWQDGYLLLDLLAKARATAHTVSEKLISRFVIERKPSGPELKYFRDLRKAMVNEFMKASISADRSQYQLKDVYRELFASPLFWSRTAYRSKAATPFEYAIRVARVMPSHFPESKDHHQNCNPFAQNCSFSFDDYVRAAGVEASLFNNTLAMLLVPSGHVPYSFPLPTGYTSANSAWATPDAVMHRSQFLTNGVGYEVDGKYRGIASSHLIPKPCQVAGCGVTFVSNSVATPSADHIVRMVGRKIFGIDPADSTVEGVLEGVNNDILQGTFYGADPNPGDSSFVIRRDPFVRILLGLLLAPEMMSK